jgi:hypothetical protein
MVSGKKAWHDYDHKIPFEMKMLMRPSAPSYPDELDNDTKCFLNLCFEIDSKERCSARELLDCEFLKK